MKIKTAVFKVSAPDLRSCPAWALPEFALIGRSNVGKSSLVNALTARRDLARVSATPGKTQLLNFYLIDDRWSLVDLPGYGYADVGRERRLEFQAAVADFLAGRDNLRCVFVLIDSRLSPQPIDLEFLRWLEGEQVPHALIFTKADKQSATQTRARVEEFKAAMSAWRAEPPEILISSARTGAGRNEILGCVTKALAGARR
jgi:GTP-binding protein